MNKILAIAGVVIRELYRRKDFYVLFILTALITLFLGGVSLINKDEAVRATREICLLLVWVATLVIAITTAARQIPSERENRTIFPLLAKPVSRWQVIVGKFVGCWLASGIGLLVFYVFIALISASRAHTLPMALYCQSLWLHWQMLGVVVALTMLGSVVLTTPSANVTIVFIVSLGILFVGEYLHKVAGRLPSPSGSLLTALYFSIPHLEIFDIRRFLVHDWPPVEWIYVGLATLYGLAYTAFFLMAACLVFRRKALN